MMEGDGVSRLANLVADLVEWFVPILREGAGDTLLWWVLLAGLLYWIFK